MAKLRKRGDTWYARYKGENGRRVEVSTNTTSKTKAQHIAEELEDRARRVRKGLDVAFQPILFEDAAAKYLKLHSELPSFQSMEGRFANHLTPTLGQRWLHSILPAQMDELLKAKLKGRKSSRGQWEKSWRPLSPQTVKHLRTHLHGLYSWALNEAKLVSGQNPVKNVPQVEVDEPEVLVLEPGQVEAFIAGAQTPDLKLLFRVALYTGMRRGELFALLWTDVDLKTRLILVTKSHGRKGTKGGKKKTRVLPIHAELVPHLEAAKKEATSKHVFPGADGGRRSKDSKMAERVRAALRAAGILRGYRHLCLKQDCRHEFEASKREPGECPKCARRMVSYPVPVDLVFHSLRATFISGIVEASGDVATAQELAGHADDRLTRRHYVKLRNAHLAAQVDRLNFPANPSVATELPHPPAETTPNNPGHPETPED